MANSRALSEFDRDRVVVTLRRVGRVTQDLRREYPDAFETAQTEPRSAPTVGLAPPTGQTLEV